MDHNFPAILFLLLRKETAITDVLRSLEQFTSEDWKNLIHLASRLGTSKILYYALKTKKLEALVPGEDFASLRKSYFSNDARNLINKTALARIAQSFKSAQIPLIVLKGAFLAEFVYPNSAMREMSDIDLLAQVDDLPKAADVLTRLGYQAEHPYVVENIPATAHHLPGFVKKGGPRIELHWTIITLEGRRPIDISVLWKRAVPIQIAGADLFALCPEDLLLHVCGHATYHHFFEVGLKALYDVVMITDHYQAEIDWLKFIQYTRDWHWERGVYIFLRLAKDLLGASIPEDVLFSLMPSNFEEAMIETAKAHLLGSEGMAGSITFPLANWQAASLPGKIKIFFQRLFLSKPYLAAQFGISPTSPFIYFYYPVRLFDLLSRYSKTTFHLWRGTASSVSFVKRKAQLQHWLGEE